MRTTTLRSGLLALMLAACAFAAPAPLAARAQTSDTDLAELAATAVRRSTSFTIFDDVSIAVSNRAVTLTGRVTMPYKRADIGALVARVDGVRSLVNDIQVLPVSQTDARLRTQVAQAIYSHSAFWHYASMPNPPIHIVVEGGRVTLTGCVNNEVERTLAYALAQVDGAFSVKNELRLDKK